MLVLVLVIVVPVDSLSACFWRKKLTPTRQIVIGPVWYIDQKKLFETLQQHIPENVLPESVTQYVEQLKRK